MLLSLAVGSSPTMAQKVYWTGAYGNISRANLDGAHMEELLARALTGPFGVAVDSTNGAIVTDQPSAMQDRAGEC